MADINIEKKSNKPVWPWILGLLLLAGVIWAVSSMDNEPDREGVAVVEQPYTNEQITTEPQSNRIVTEEKDFVAFVEDKDTRDRMGTDHQLTSEALNKLAASLKDISGNDDKYSQQIGEIEQIAQEVQSDPQSLQHADKMNSAFTSAADVMSQIQQDRFPDAESDVKDVKEAANELKSNEPLLDQKDAVNNFFEKAADAIEEMQEEVTQS